MWCEIPDQIYLPCALSHLKVVLVLENCLSWSKGTMNVSMGDWQGLSSSVAPFFKMYGFIRKRVFQKSIRSLAMNSIFTVLFFPPPKNVLGGGGCLTNTISVAIPFCRGLFPYQFKSLVANTLSVICHRSYYKEECQNRIHSSQPLR